MTHSWWGPFLFPVSFNLLIFLGAGKWPVYGLNWEVVLGFWRVAVWSSHASTFVQYYKWDVLAPVAASLGRERAWVTLPWCFFQALSTLLPSLCWSHPRRLSLQTSFAFAWESGVKKQLLLYPFLKGKSLCWVSGHDVFKVDAGLFIYLILNGQCSPFSLRCSRGTQFWTTSPAGVGRSLPCHKPVFTGPHLWSPVCFLHSN